MLEAIAVIVNLVIPAVTVKQVKYSFNDLMFFKRINKTFTNSGTPDISVLKTRQITYYQKPC